MSLSNLWYYDLAESIKDTDVVFDKKTGAAIDFAIENLPKAFSTKDTHWTHICRECVKKYEIVSGLDQISGPDAESLYGKSRYPPCGVVGCDNMSTYFYDFECERDKFIAHVRRANL